MCTLLWGQKSFTASLAKQVLCLAGLPRRWGARHTGWRSVGPTVALAPGTRHMSIRQK